MATAGKDQANLDGCPVAPKMTQPGKYQPQVRYEPKQPIPGVGQPAARPATRKGRLVATTANLAPAWTLWSPRHTTMLCVRGWSDVGTTDLMEKKGFTRAKPDNGKACPGTRAA